MYQIVGKQFLDYVSKKTGKRIRGGKLYLISADSRVEGFKTEDIFVREDQYNKYFASLPLESFIDLYFDNNGYVVACSVISDRKE